MRENPVIGITMGDPGGIGPEIILKCLGGLRERKAILFGSVRVFKEHASRLGQEWNPARVNFVDLDNVPQPYFGSNPGVGGAASVRYLEAAFDAYREGRIHALVTGPIHKESWHAAGFRYPGQTEYCAEQTDAQEYCMLMAGEHFRIALLTTHLSVSEAIRLVRKEAIVQRLHLLVREFVRLGYRHPRIACAALNPHAGEGGSFGSEELQEIIPALEEARAGGIMVDGPLAPEVVFRIAAAENKWDVILALYHDQAMIPIKLLDFHACANVTLGLPLIRTSPDHGTAFDIAGRGIADPGSMKFAIDLAYDWTIRRNSAHANPRT